MAGVFTDPKKLIAVIFAPPLILAGALFLDYVSLGFVQVVLAFFYLGVGMIYIYLHLEKRSAMSNAKEEIESTTISKSMDLNEAMDTLREWTSENYAEQNEVHFQWSSTHYDTTVEKDPQTGDEYMFYAFITYGEYNRLTLFCIEGKNGDIVAHKPVRWEGMLMNPFDYVPMVQQLRKKAWNYNGTGDNPFQQGQGQQANWKSVYQSQGTGNNMPMNQNMFQQDGQFPQINQPQNQQSNNSSGNQDSGEENDES